MKIDPDKNTFCRKCELYKKVNSPCMMGRGNVEADILFLGECPGSQEDKEGEIFVGPPGKLLQYYVENLGIDCYVSNAVLCRNTDKSGKDKAPTPTMLDCCRAATIDLILRMKPKVIVALGRVPMVQLLKVGANMEAARGKPFYFSELDLYVVPTYHPDYLIKQRAQRNETRYFTDFKNDLVFAQSLCTTPMPRKIQSMPETLKDSVDIIEYLKKLKESTAFSLDLETTGLNSKVDRITDISFCSVIGQGIHIRWDYISEDPEKIKLLQEALESSAEKVFHNAGFDIEFLRAVGFRVKEPIFDTMLGYHTISMSFEGGKAASLYKLKTMAWFITREGGYDDILSKYGGIVGAQQLLESDEEIEDDIEPVPLFSPQEIAESEGLDPEVEERLHFTYNYVDKIREEKLDKLKLAPKEYYSAMDADVTFRIYMYLKIIIDRDYSFVYYNIVMPACLALVRLHESGVKIDLPYVDKLILENNKKAEAIKEEFLNKIKNKVDVSTFNINSTDQLSNYMYNILKLPKNKKYTTAKLGAPSTDEAALKFYSKKRPELNIVLEYRGVNKETSTYLVGYKKIVDERSRVYPNYNQVGTATGRCSCTKPNLQNVPRDNRIRNMVVPKDGHKIILADLSQVELRVLAMISEDVAMKRAFLSGHDFHSYTACSMFNIKVAEFDKENKKHSELRSVAKTINFGMVYQRGAPALAEQVNISVPEAESFMRKFFKSYPQVGAWVSYIKSFAKHHGYVENIYGRRRYLPDIQSTNTGFRSGAERKAVNTPIQSSASDIFLFGLIRAQEWLDANNIKSKIIGTVHDSVLLETPESEVALVAENIPRIMTEDIPKVTIELKSDVDILDKWVK